MGRQGIEGKGVFPGNDRLKAEADYVDTSLGHTVTVLTVQYSGDGAVERTPLSYPRRYVCVEGGGQSWCMASTPQCTWSLASQLHVQLQWAFVDSLRS